MRVHGWQDIVTDVIDAGGDPDAWRAVGGRRSRGIGEDLYLAHPRTGVFQLKTYAKNPYEVKGVGVQVARRLDDELGDFFPAETDARFAVQRAPRSKEEARTRARRVGETVRAHAKVPTTRDHLFTDVMEALESPAFGPMQFVRDDRPSEIQGLASTFNDAESVLEAEFEDLLRKDQVDHGFF